MFSDGSSVSSCLFGFSKQLQNKLTGRKRDGTDSGVLSAHPTAQSHGSQRVIMSIFRRHKRKPFLLPLPDRLRN